MKEINRIWKIYQNIRIPPTMLRNGTVILLYSKALKHLACSDTPQYQSHSQNVIPGTEKRQKSLKDHNKIWKKYQNIRITPPILWITCAIWEMGLSFYYIPKSQITPQGVTHPSRHTFMLFKQPQFCLQNWERLLKDLFQI